MVLNSGWGRLVNYVAMLLVVCQFTHYIIGYEDWINYQGELKHAAMKTTAQWKHHCKKWICILSNCIALASLKLSNIDNLICIQVQKEIREIHILHETSHYQISRHNWQRHVRYYRSKVSYHPHTRQKSCLKRQDSSLARGLKKTASIKCLRNV